MIWYEFQLKIDKLERESMKTILIRIGIALVLKWLAKKDNTNPVVKGLLDANSTEAIADVLKSKGMEDAVVEIVTEAAAEPVGNILSKIFRGS